MKIFLQNLLRCPSCFLKLDMHTFVEKDNETIEGMLVCSCGMFYPVWKSIPRMLPDTRTLFPEFFVRYFDVLARLGIPTAEKPTEEQDKFKKRTQESFGYQWNQFPHMVEQNRKFFFSNYSSVPASFYQGKLGLDAGCGFGRHIYYANEYGATMIGLDYSAAIDAAANVTKGKPNIHLVQGDIYNPPFADGTFDFVYSFGVLHHLPDPLRGFCSLLPKIKKGGTAFVWLYGKQRKVLNGILEGLRTIFKHLPVRVLKPIALGFALFDYFVTIQPFKVLSTLLPITQWIPSLNEGRLSIYTKLPFKVTYADWYDRLSPPLRFYYDEADLAQWVEAANLKNARIEPTGRFGWKLYGEVR